MPVEVSTADGATVLRADTYQVAVAPNATTVLLADAGGRPWLRLSLLASLDRVDVADESFDLGRVEIEHAGDAVEVSLSTSSSAWAAKRTVLACFGDRAELSVHVEGSGTLTAARVCGGRAQLASGACGAFASGISFASVFVPTPTEPVRVVRPASVAATLGVVGDAEPGRVHGIFSPPPLCLAFGRELPSGATQVPDSEVLSIGVVAAMSELRFTELRYLPVDGGFALEFDYDGHTDVRGHFATPPFVLRPAADALQALAGYRDDLVGRGLAPDGPPGAPAAWWREPIFCGWGAQCARARRTRTPAPDLARQQNYDAWLTLLDAQGIRPGTVVIDDRWQAAYGTAEPDPEHWPDLRGWIAARHAAGQRVLLWWKAWDPSGLPAEECVLTGGGRAISADPGSAAYLRRLRGIVARLLSADGLDADGFKIDFTQRAPAGRTLARPGAPADAPWGIAALHVLLATIHTAAKAVKPDALLVTHTPHPGFGDVTDMIRLNDVLERDVAGALVPAVDQLGFRHRIAAASLPHHLIDTDQWPIVDRAAWRAYVEQQGRLGVPALYYAESIDGSGEPLTADDYALVRRTWETYRAGLG